MAVAASTFGSNNDILRAMELGAQAWDLAEDGCDSRVWYDATGAVEADIRFSDRVRWSASGGSGDRRR